MNIPGFTAEASLFMTRGAYSLTGQSAGSHANAVIPAIPRCENCEDLLEYCRTHGGRPRAACIACATGHCDSGVERPPWLLNPFAQHPF